MLKRFLRTTLIAVILFLLIVVLGLISKVVTKNNSCDDKNPACPENYLCNFNQQICVQAEKCSSIKPEVCITLYDPVCSNGKEYSNSCFACMEGVEYYYKGKC